MIIRPTELHKWPKGSNVDVQFDGKQFRLSNTLNILGKSVDIGPKSGRPTLFADGKLMAHFSAGKSASGVNIGKLLLDSHDSYKQRPNGFMLHGRSVNITDIWGQNLKDFFNFTENANGVFIDACKNTGSIDGYFAYVKGLNQTLRGCLSNRALAGFIRVNNCIGLNILDCESYGVTGNEDGIFFVGRIQLQYVSEVYCKNTRLHNAILTTGPLWNIDGWNQRESDAEFFARRTKNVEIEDLLVDGKGWLEVRAGSENINIKTVGKTPQIKFGYPDPKLPKWVQDKLAPATKVWLNGKKIK